MFWVLLLRVTHEGNLGDSPYRNQRPEAKNEMKKLLIVLTLLLAMPAFADDLEEYVKLLKTDLNAQAKRDHYQRNANVHG